MQTDPLSSRAKGSPEVVHQMKEDGVIEPSSSLWASPVFLMKKRQSFTTSHQRHPGYFGCINTVLNVEFEKWFNGLRECDDILQLCHFICTTHGLFEEGYGKRTMGILMENLLSISR